MYYDFVNCLMPGAVFCVLLNYFFGICIDGDTFLGDICIYFFAGLVINRIGSLTIEPLLKRIKFVSFGPYKDYLSASHKDPEIKIFSQNANMYRALSSLFAILSVVCAASGCKYLIVCLALLLLFLFSYRKQIGFIKQRIDNSR